MHMESSDLSAQRKMFNTYGDVIITSKGLPILIKARHLWPFSSEGSLTCHTYCDTGQPFKIVIILGLLRSGFKQQTFPMRCKRSKYIANSWFKTFIFEI